MRVSILRALSRIGFLILTISFTGKMLRLGFQLKGCCGLYPPSPRTSDFLDTQSEKGESLLCCRRIYPCTRSAERRSAMVRWCEGVLQPRRAVHTHHGLIPRPPVSRKGGPQCTRKLVLTLPGHRHLSEGLSLGERGPVRVGGQGCVRTGQVGRRNGGRRRVNASCAGMARCPPRMAEAAAGDTRSRHWGLLRPRTGSACVREEICPRKRRMEARIRRGVRRACTAEAPGSTYRGRCGEGPLSHFVHLLIFASRFPLPSSLTLSFPGVRTAEVISAHGDVGVDARANGRRGRRLFYRRVGWARSVANRFAVAQIARADQALVLDMAVERDINGAAGRGHAVVCDRWGCPRGGNVSVSASRLRACIARGVRVLHWVCVAAGGLSRKRTGDGVATRPKVLMLMHTTPRVVFFPRHKQSLSVADAQEGRERGGGFHPRGHDGIVHGGMLATLLDEVAACAPSIATRISRGWSVRTPPWQAVALAVRAGALPEVHRQTEPAGMRRRRDHECESLPMRVCEGEARRRQQWVVCGMLHVRLTDDLARMQHSVPGRRPFPFLEVSMGFLFVDGCSTRRIVLMQKFDNRGVDFPRPPELVYGEIDVLRDSSQTKNTRFLHHTTLVIHLIQLEVGLAKDESGNLCFSPTNAVHPGQNPNLHEETSPAMIGRVILARHYFYTITVIIVYYHVRVVKQVKSLAPRDPCLRLVHD
ncbi:hypothetical protein C8R47DRAFT_1199535 [Mycena vitilis]|nr:hypothetical protein C8R47DRAFT_1199535 [Mycena vitilis]